MCIGFQHIGFYVSLINIFLKVSKGGADDEKRGSPC